MQGLRNPRLAGITLLFFFWMTLFPSAYAREFSVTSPATGQDPALAGDTAVYAVDSTQLDGVQAQLHQQGYALRPASAAELRQLQGAAHEQPWQGMQLALNDSTVAQKKTAECNGKAATGSQTQADPATATSAPATPTPAAATAAPDTAAAPAPGATSPGTTATGNGQTATGAPASSVESAPPATPPCESGTADGGQNEAGTTPAGAPAEREPVRPHGHVSVGVGGSVNVVTPPPSLPMPPLPKIDNGKGGEIAAVLFVFIGVVVVAVLVVYAVKYILDVLTNGDHDYWWDLTLQQDSLSTSHGEHGDFFAGKLASGYIANSILYIGLVGELGYMDIKLKVERTSGDDILDLAGAYWLLGGALRLGNFAEVREGASGANYFFMEVMGGTSEFSETDIIGSAKLGFNYEPAQRLRLGVHVGARYIGLNEKAGFVNGDNSYWLTYGVDAGWRF